VLHRVRDDGSEFRKALAIVVLAPENAASLRVAEKLGYAEFARTTYKELPSVLLRREAKEDGSCR
jgi:hypothetical protein